MPRFPIAPGLRSARYALLVFALAFIATLHGCYKYVVLLGDVKYEAVSPPYVLQLVNKTGAPFVVECVRFCDTPATGHRQVAAGASFELMMQVRKFRVAGTDITGSNQVLDAPYISQDGSNTAVVRVRHVALYELTVDLESPKWFAPRESASAQLPPLRVELREFTPRRWFLDGPP